jgi:hypothetical protein
MRYSASCIPAVVRLCGEIILFSLRPPRLGGEAGCNKIQAIKNPAVPGFLLIMSAGGLLDLGFLVHHVLAHHWIEFLDFHLLRHVALVLGRGVVVTGTGAGDEFDFLTHVVGS